MSQRLALAQWNDRFVCLGTPCAPTCVPSTCAVSPHGWAACLVCLEHDQQIPADTNIPTCCCWCCCSCCVASHFSIMYGLSLLVGWLIKGDTPPRKEPKINMVHTWHTWPVCFSKGRFCFDRIQPTWPLADWPRHAQTISWTKAI